MMLYDAFTSGPPLMLEALGLAKRGEGVHFFEEGRSTPGGTLPINTNGGGLSYTHSGMYGIFPIIESVRQLDNQPGWWSASSSTTRISWRLVRTSSLSPTEGPAA